MALSIKSEEADRLARQLASITGESLTDAVTESIRLRLAQARRRDAGLADRLMTISAEGRKLERFDTRTDEEIIGYDDHGLPG